MMNASLFWSDEPVVIIDGFGYATSFFPQKKVEWLFIKVFDVYNRVEFAICCLQVEFLRNCWEVLFCIVYIYVRDMSHSNRRWQILDDISETRFIKYKHIDDTPSTKKAIIYRDSIGCHCLFLCRYTFCMIWHGFCFHTDPISCQLFFILKNKQRRTAYKLY